MFKKTVIPSILVLTFFVILAIGSGSSSSGMSSYGNYSSSSSSSNDMYSKPAEEGVCYVCGGRGYFNRNGSTEKCYPCNGTGKAVKFPER